MARNRKDIDITLDIENFGPLTDLHHTDLTQSMKMGIFANNGLGKTFISRAFRLASPQSSFTPANDLKKTNNILTTNQDKGKFTFNIAQDGNIKKLEIVLNRNSEPIITDDTGYLFHVFNSDYVADNLGLNDYNPPSDDIQGYILGKLNIDVEKEKSSLQKLKEKQKRVQNVLNEAIEIAKKDLDNLKITKSISEYKRINFKDVMDDSNIKEDETFESLKIDYNQLGLMPDDQKDLEPLNYNIEHSILNDVKTVLSNPYEKSNLPLDFVNQIKSNQRFIEDGIELYKLNTKNCPFCKEELTEHALKIIDLYNKYLQDSESKTISEIEHLIKKLKNLRFNIENHYHDFNTIIIDFNEVKKYLPSFKNNELKSLKDNKMVLEKIEELIGMLNIKKEDIKSTIFEPENLIMYINKFLNQLKEDLKVQITEITKLNTAKNSTKAQKLLLKRQLCNARYLIIRNDQKLNIEKIMNLDSEIKEMESDIAKKENKSKINKKEKVIESLQHFLGIFFLGKYSFDEKKFCITFMNKSLTDNATHVLSDGEKGIVAFCYYLATVHTIIEKEDDYKRLFFVIDDPISSMDYNFVYAVAQFISEINNYYDSESSFNRFIILTHNLEFMNLLISNGIINQKYILNKNKITKYQKNLILPYQNHLYDIVKISEKESNPSHTTGNSIRHVLETICKFENQNKSLNKFMSEDPILNNHAYINRLIQSLSHGELPSQSLPDEYLINACEVVIDYLKDKYPGQIEDYLKKES